MIVKRNELTWFERLYLPALIGGLKVTTRHFINTITGTTKVTQQYPEEDRKSTRLNSSHSQQSRMPSSA